MNVPFALSVLLAASSVATAGSFEQEVSRGVAAAAAPARAFAAQAPACADFSGKWAGDCPVGGGKSVRTEFTLKQDRCDSLEYSFGKVSFDRANTITHSIPAYDDMRIVDYPRWDAGKTAFDRNVTLFALNTATGKIFQEATTERWELKGPRLVMTQKWHQIVTTGGVAKEIVDSTVCTLDKQP